MAKLFEMTFGELGGGITLVLRRRPPIALPLAQFTTPSRCGGLIVKVQAHMRAGITLERARRVGHFQRILQYADLARIGDSMMLKGLDDLEPEAAGVVPVVALDRRALEHEGDAAIGLVQANGHFRGALVGSITQSHEAPEPLFAVEKVVIGAFVEV